jgi:hypothetical protein
MIPENPSNNKLEAIYKRTINAEPEFFISTARELFDELERQKKIDLIDAYASAQESNDTALLRQREQELQQELLSIQEKTEAYCTNHGIKLPPGFMNPTDMNEFRVYEQSKLIGSGGLLANLFDAISNELSFLLSENPTQNLDFVKQFADVNENGHIICLKIALTIDEWDCEKHELKRIQTKTFWHSWHQLKHACDIWNNFKNRRREALAKNDHLTDWHVWNTFKKIEGITIGKQPKYMQELKYHLEKVHLHIAEASLPEPISKNLTRTYEQTSRLESYDAASGGLRVGQYTIKFVRPNSKCREILKILTKNPSVKLSWDAIYEKIQKTDPPKGHKAKRCKRSLYHSYEHICKEASKQTQGKITDLLLYNMNSVRINPDYLD